MKASLRVLPDVVVLSLTNVVRSKAPLKVGDFVALNGAWDRKKQVVGFKADHNGYGPCVLLQNVGRIFSDGRYVKPVKASKPVVDYINGGSYVHVVPGKNPAKKLTLVTGYDTERRQAVREYQRNWKQERAQQIRGEIAYLQAELDKLLG
jgi:hypothetical protein